MRFLLFSYFVFVLAPGFGQQVCHEDDIDSVMMTMPLRGMKGLDIADVLKVRLFDVPMEHRMEHAFRIMHYFDSLMATMDDEAHVVALYTKGKLYSDVMNLRPNLSSFSGSLNLAIQAFKKQHP